MTFLPATSSMIRIAARRAAAAAGAVLALAAVPASSENWESDGGAFGQMLREAWSENWTAAREQASLVSDPVALSVYEWLRLRSGSDDWADYTEFLQEHSDWPGLLILRRSAEAAISAEDDPVEIVEFFEPQPPQTGAGALRLAQAWLRLGDRSEAADAIIDGWLSLPFDARDFDRALELFGGILVPYHEQRLDNLLWEARFDEAEDMFDLVGQDWALLAKARMALKNQVSGVDIRIANVPSHLQSDPGLAYERVVWRLLNDAEDRAISLLIEQSASSNSLGKPELWANRRHRIAHSLMRQGDSFRAYRVASSHRIILSEQSMSWMSESRRLRAARSARSNFAELEWLSGYLALRQLDDPARAISHFERYSGAVSSPVSTAKAAFWLGLAYNRADNSGQFIDEFRRAASFQTTFYGQLAAQILGLPTDPELYGRVRHADSTGGFETVPVVRAGLLAHYSGDDSMAAWFLAHWAERLSGEEFSRLAELARRHGAEFSAIKVAKEGLKRNYVDIDYLFPLNGMDEIDLPVPHELAIAVARQETEFRDSAVSRAGAVGLMQIKPSTAREVAGRIGISGDINRHLRVRETNAMIGAAYLLERLEQFTGSWILTTASYNAGPGRVSGWLNQIGDPRDSEVDPVDWIEHIPYGETRNYVMRVLEAASVYRLRMLQRDEKIDIISYLESG